MMLVVVSVIAFALLSSAGGDALTALSDNPQISEETIEQLRRVYGLDRPVVARYVSWLTGLICGEMGESFYFRTPVRGLVLSRLWNTSLLGLAALFIAAAVAVTLSFLSVRLRKPLLERIIQILILFTASTPRIVLALFALAAIIAVSGSAISVRNGSVASLLISAIVLSVPLIALFLAQTHDELNRAMTETFVQLARAKGLSENAVILRHASRAALNPLLTIFGLSLGSLVGGSVIVEMVLSWPGIGALMVQAVRGRDVPLVMGIVVTASAAVWFGNTLAEILQLLNDKRLTVAEEI
jgi:peptide/nickel transport system permease protein